MRVVTRGDLDGLTCAVLLGINEGVDDFLLTHPQEITDGQVEIRPTDIIANLPYHPNCALWFDHHLHTATVAAPAEDFKGAFGQAPSAARLVYEHYGGRAKMPEFEEQVRETDRLDSADLTLNDILNPEGFIKLGFTIDGRSGLGPFETYFMTLLHLLIKKIPLQQVLAHPQVESRYQRLEEEDIELRAALRGHSWVDENVVVTDLRGLERVPVGNRFLVFAVFQEINVAVRVQWGPRREYAMMTLGHNILNRTCRTNLGDLAARYGGGGHQGAASIKLTEDPDALIQMIVAELKANG